MTPRNCHLGIPEWQKSHQGSHPGGGGKTPGNCHLRDARMTDFPSWGGYDTLKLPSGDPRMAKVPSGVPSGGGVKHQETVI